MMMMNDHIKVIGYSKYYSYIEILKSYTSIVINIYILKKVQIIIYMYIIRNILFQIKNILNVKNITL